jgi:hypothetical protein
LVWLALQMTVQCSWCPDIYVAHGSRSFAGHHGVHGQVLRANSASGACLVSLLDNVEARLRLHLSLSVTGDIFLLDERDIIHTNLSVREGLGE